MLQKNSKTQKYKYKKTELCEQWQQDDSRQQCGKYKQKINLKFKMRIENEMENTNNKSIQSLRTTK